MSVVVSEVVLGTTASGSPNFYTGGWEAAYALFNALKGLTQEESVELVEGFVAGMDNAVNSKKYAEMELQRIARDLKE